MERIARGSAVEAYFVWPGNDASHVWQLTHTLCDRTVPSVINSVSWLTSPCFSRNLLWFAVVIASAPTWEKARARLRLRRISMSTQRGFVSADQFHPDPYTQSRTAERTLNSAIVHAEITRSYEEYIEIFDEFYAEEIEGSSETMSEPIRGKARVRSLLYSFLVPLHVMAEVGGVSISIRETLIPGDAIDETHSAWTLELAGVTGKICTVSWRILRKWNDSRVVLEHHYDHQQSGEPLSDGDLRLNLLETPTGFHKSS
jgi:hypothetical protein